MNQAQQSHPTIEQLTAFGRGELGDIEHADIEKHLADCDACCQTLQDLPEDTIIALLREHETDTSVSPDRLLVAANVQAAFPVTIGQVTIPPADSPTRLTEETDLTGKQRLPAELSDHSRYDVLELLGKGGMGDVYKAHHRMMNRPVALKLINRQLVQNEAAIKRFHREVQAAARLSHPNIVTAYDAEQADDVHILVMEFVKGMDLAEVVRQRGSIPVPQACEYVRQSAAGLQHAHELGMVHRDIKPQNLMLAEDGKVKILDFGLANFATETAVEQGDDSEAGEAASSASPHLTMMGSMMGTPDYMAPEQAQDAHSADIRADIYSLGCTLYCLLTGKAPFSEGSVMDKVIAHSQREAPLLSEVNSDVPAELAAVVQRMMAKSPDERYQTPADVVAALEPFAKHPSPHTSHAKPSSKHAAQRTSVMLPMIVATLLIGLFIALATVIVVATNQGRLEIHSEVEDVQIVVKRGGVKIEILDLKTGSQVNWLSTGKYELELIGDDNVVKLNENSFQMTRLGKVIVTVKWNSEGAGVVKSFAPSDQPITQDGVESDEGGWRITAADTRSVPLFEVKDPSLQTGPFFYRAKLKTENVKGHAHLEMWVRFPGEGEYFSKGIDQPLSGTNGWAEYEIPFLLKKGQQPDLVKLNLTIEGGGTVWIKDIELLGRTTTAPDASEIDEKLLDESGGTTQVHRFAGHSFGTRGELAVSLDGELLATFGTDGVRIWDIMSGRQRDHVLVEDVCSIVFLKHDSRLIAVGTTAGEVEIWNVDLKRQQRVLGGHAGEVHSLALSPDGNTLAAASIRNEKGDARLWDLNSFEPTTLIEEPTWRVTFTPNGERVITASQAERGTLRIWDVNAHNKIAEMTNVMSVRHFIKAFAVSPDGKHLAVGGGNWRTKSGELLLVDLATLSIIRRYHNAVADFRDVAFSPDGQWLGVGAPNGRAILLDVQTFADPVSWTAYDWRQTPAGRIVSGLAFSSDGKTLFTAADSEDACLWRLPESVWSNVEKQITPVRRMIGQRGSIGSLAFLPDSRQLISVSNVGSAGSILVWDCETGIDTELSSGRPAAGLAVSPDGKQLAAGRSGDGCFNLYDAKTGVFIARFPGPGEPVAVRLSFSSDGRRVVSAGADKIVRLWDVDDQRELRRFDTADLGQGVGEGHRTTYSADGRFVATLDADGKTHVWNAEAGDTVHVLDTQAAPPVHSAFTPDGKLLILLIQTIANSGVGEDLQVFETSTGKELWRKTAHKSGSISLAMSSHGDFVVTAGLRDKTLRVWETLTGRELLTSPVAEDVGTALAVSPDSRYVASSRQAANNSSSSIQLWRLPESVWPETTGPGRWTQLFNGKDLSGWKSHPKQPGNWRVEEDAIVGRGPLSSHLYTDREDYENFHLRAEMKLSGGDSGIFFRCGSAPAVTVASEVDPQLPAGYEANACFGPNQLRSGSLWVDPGIGLTGPKSDLIEPDQWFTLEVLANGNRLIVKVNGSTTADYVDNERRHVRGHLALQVWTRDNPTVVRFRKIEIKELSPDEPTAIERLQGKWGPDSCLMRGKSLSAEQLARMSITLTGNSAELTDPDSGQTQSGTFSIDADRSPKHIDFIAPDGKERMPGIFEFDGERLKLAWVDGDYARPTDFSPSDKPDHMTGVFTIVPGSASAAVPQDEPDASLVLDETQIEIVKAAEAYLSVVDEGKFGSLRDMVSSWAKQQVTREQVSQTYQKLRDTFGKAEQRTLVRVQVYDELPDLPKGRFAAVQYETDFARQKGLWEVLLLNVDTDGKWRANSYQVTLQPPPFPEAQSDPAIEEKKQAALTAAQEWLKLVDAGKYAESWQTSAKINREGITEQKMVNEYNELFKPLGQLKSRAHQTSEYTTQMPRAPVGEYAVIQFRTQFTNQPVIETVVLTREPDGQWRIAGYRHAEDNSVSKPPPSLPIGQNLIIDPSLEDTAVGERYPQDWGTGNIIPKDAYKHQVVEGGRTGEHGWMIEGDGQYAVIPTNRPPAHRAYRYAASAWVQAETGSAQIKLLYFTANGQYLGENRSAVSIKRDGWHRLTVVDDLENFPVAGKLSLAVTLIGKGKAVFDDLELIAFDAEKLPDNFETEYGSTAKHDPAMFDRWVGRWETTTEYKQTSETEAKTINSQTVVRKILDDRFLLWQIISEADGPQYMAILGFDEHIDAYHIWLFGSAGEIYERIGQWDAAAGLLSLDVKPPSPGITGISTDRFVDNDHIESTLLVKNADGQVTRDLRMNWVRKSSTVSVDIDLSSGPVSRSQELALLYSMAGDWTIKQTMKPSIWFPDGGTEMITEKTAWTIGGRFLLLRSYDDKQHMKTLALMGYDPKEKSYHYWHFASDVPGGQWRITWDDSSRGFHWRSIDMPTGWIGTGFNRWIDDDTFDNQALIKDEQGRVLLDSQQEKKRKK